MNVKRIKQKDRKIQRGVRDTVDGDRKPNAHFTRTPAEKERQNEKKYSKK